MEDKLAYFRGWRDASYDVAKLLEDLSETAGAGAGVTNPCASTLMKAVSEHLKFIADSVRIKGDTALAMAEQTQERNH